MTMGLLFHHHLCEVLAHRIIIVIIVVIQFRYTQCLLLMHYSWLLNNTITSIPIGVFSGLTLLQELFDSICDVCAMCM